MACTRDGCGMGVDRGRLYGWRGDVMRATGLGRPALDRLERSGLLEIRRLGRVSFVRGDELIEAIWAVADVAEGKEASR